MSHQPGPDSLLGPDEDILELADSVLEKIAPDVVRLSSGRLPLEEVATACGYDTPSVVAIVGESGAGKTTFISGLYERLVTGSCKDMQFAGSESFVSFEDLRHNALLASKNVDHQPLKTVGVELYHLQVLPRGGRLRHVIMADVSGESLSRLRDSRTFAENLALIKRADHLFFLVDGGAIVCEERRHLAYENMNLAFVRLKDDELVNRFCKVSLVFNKADLLASSDNDDVQKMIERMSRLSTEAWAPRSLDVFRADSRALFSRGSLCPDVDRLLQLSCERRFQGMLVLALPGEPPAIHALDRYGIG